MSTWTAKAKAPGSDIRGLTSAASGIVKRRSAEITCCSASAFGRIAAALHLSSRRSPSARRDRPSDPVPSGPRRPPQKGSASRFFLPVFVARGRGRVQRLLQGRSFCPGSPSSARRSSDRRSRRASGGRLAATRTAAGLLLAGAVLFAAPVLPGAGGQARAEVLVSNIGLALETSYSGTLDRDYAQAFTTGSNGLGYTLTSVEIGIETTETPTGSLISVPARAMRRAAWSAR